MTKQRRCNRRGLVIFDTELDAKIALAERIRKDKGEAHYFQCGNHYHLSRPLTRPISNGKIKA